MDPVVQLRKKNGEVSGVLGGFQGSFVDLKGKPGNVDPVACVQKRRMTSLIYAQVSSNALIKLYRLKNPIKSLNGVFAPYNIQHVRNYHHVKVNPNSKSHKK